MHHQPEQPAPPPPPGLTRVERAPELVPPLPQLDLYGSGGMRTIRLGTEPLTIGRSPSCEVPIEHPQISNRHLLVQASEYGYTAMDLGSTNGTLLNGQPLPAGHVQLLVQGDRLTLAESDGQFPEVVCVFQAGIQNRPARVHGLPQRPVRIGRAAADIILDHPLVSRLHARIEPYGSRHRLVALSTTQETLVNGEPLRHTGTRRNHSTRTTPRHTTGRMQAVLQHGDVIQIGMFQLVYQGESVDEYDRRGAALLQTDQVTVWVPGCEQPILDRVNFRAEPGQLVGLIGRSGAGKSSLLAVLRGMLAPSSGRVSFNRLDPLAEPPTVGFVPQDDTLHHALTVEEALSYNARLRLPPDTRPGERQVLIDAALRRTELEAQRQQLIGTLSGGQRRRAMIAAELVIDPLVFFLDEPTAGLDPGLERRIFLLLRNLADEGRIVVVATHAAGSLGLCDSVALIHHGQLLNQATAAQLVRQFNVNDMAGLYQWLADQAAPALPLSAVRSANARPRQALVQASSFFVQARTLVERTWTLLLRDRRNLLIMLAQAPAIGLLLALVARADAFVGERAALSEARKVLFLLATTIIWCGVINAARAIAGERTILHHEQHAGVQLRAYLLAKFVVLAGLVALQAALLLGITLLKVQMPATSLLMPLPLELYITTVLAGLAGLAGGLLISAAARTADRALSLVPIAIIPQILFAGVIFALGDGVTAQRILSWLTISRWAMDAYGSSVNLNTLPLMPGLLLPLQPALEYSPTVEHLLGRWLILGSATILALFLTWWVLWRQRSRR